MILLIDNYDSFSYNLYQLIGGINPDIKVIRNDELSVEEILALKPSHIIISPGPGRPCDAGVCEDVIKAAAGKVPLRGVVARYHSLAASETGFPDCLKVTARTNDGEIMAVEHKQYPIFGVQFHPESILTQHGRKMAENFLEVTL